MLFVCAFLLHPWCLFISQCTCHFLLISWILVSSTLICQIGDNCCRWIRMLLILVLSVVYQTNVKYACLMLIDEWYIVYCIWLFEKTLAGFLNQTENSRSRPGLPGVDQGYPDLNQEYPTLPGIWIAHCDFTYLLFTVVLAIIGKVKFVSANNKGVALWGRCYNATNKCFRFGCLSSSCLGGPSILFPQMLSDVCASST